MLWIQGLTAVLLVQGRGEMAIMPAVTTVLLHHSAMNTGLTAVLLVQGRGEIAVMPAVTTVLLHHSAMDTGTESNDFTIA